MTNLFARLSVLLVGALAVTACSGSDARPTSTLRDVTSSTSVSETSSEFTSIPNQTAGPMSTTIDPRPLADGASVIDLLMSDGTRLALLLPTEMVPDELVLFAGESEARLVGEGVDVAVSYAICPDSGVAPNAQGALVSRTSRAFAVCRVDQNLLALVTTNMDIPRAALDLFDLVPIELGQEYLTATRDNHLFNICCEDFGPLRVDGLVVTANRYTSGTVKAWDPHLLEPVWAMDMGDSSLLLGAVDDFILATPGRGRVVAIKSSNGVEAWRVSLGEMEEVKGAAPSLDRSVWYVTTDFPVEGDRTRPMIYAIEVSTGIVIWAKAGRADTEFQIVDPAVFSDVVVVMDLPEFVPEGGTSTTAHLVAYETGDGETRWSADLADPREAWSPDLLAHDAARNILIAASTSGSVFSIDPATGLIRWTTQTGFVRITALEEDSVVLELNGEQLSLDLVTGLPR